MKSTSTETLFQRFRDDHDLAALAQVYDRTAPHLLALAKRLKGPGEQAEDLLQETFLVAIEQPGAWTEDRPLGPWLLGILTHRAQSGRRRSARPLDPDRVHNPVVASPEELAHATEFQRDALSAIASLPPLLRGTVQGVLMAGNKPSQIAVELGIKPGTARQRLKRGLGQVRLHLRGSGWGLLAWLGLRSSELRSVRRNLLKVAENQVPAAALQGPLSSSGSSTIGVAKVGMALALGVGLLWTNLPEPKSSPPGLEHGQPSDSLARSVSEPPTNLGTNEPNSKPESKQRTQANLPQLTIQVRDLAGEPVANMPLGFIDHATYVSFDWEHPLPPRGIGQTDHLGNLTIISPKLTCSIVGQNSDWLVVENAVVQAASSGSHTVLVRKGGSIHGVVMGELGPLQGASVSALVSMEFLTLGKEARAEARRTGPKPGLFDPENVRQTYTDKNGRFELRGLLASSSRIDVLAAGYRPLLGEYVGPAPGQSARAGELTLKRGVKAIVHATTANGEPPNGRLFMEARTKEYCRGINGLPFGPQGKLALEAIAPGEYNWRIETEGSLHTKGRFTVPTQGGEISISIPKQRRFRVLIQDSVGLPIPSGLIRAKEAGTTRQEFSSDKVVELRCGLQHTAWVAVRADDYAPSGFLAIPPDQDRLVVQLQKLGALDLDGFQGWDEVLAVAIPERQKDMLQMLKIGRSPKPLERYQLSTGRLTLAALEPGKNWVVLDLGEDPFALGPFEIKEGQTTRSVASLPRTQDLTLLVVDADTGLPIPGVGTQMIANGRLPAGKASFLLEFLGSPDHATTTAPNGKLVMSLRPDGDSQLRLSREGYLTQFIPRTDWLAAGPSLTVSMRPLPEIECTIEFGTGQPASFARVDFSKGPAATSAPAGRARMDEAGLGKCEGTSPGRLTASVRYSASDALKYLIQLPNLEIQPSEPIHINLLPELARLSIGDNMLTDAQGFVLRRKPDKTCTKFQVSWERSAETLKPESISVLPGDYRIEIRGRDFHRYGRVQVAPEELRSIPMDNELGTLEVQIPGIDWQSAQLHLTALAGPYSEVRRTVQVQPGAPLSIRSLPHGLYRVQLSKQWPSGTTRQSQLAYVDFNPSQVEFAAIPSPVD